VGDAGAAAHDAVMMMCAISEAIAVDVRDWEEWDFEGRSPRTDYALAERGKDRELCGLFQPRSQYRSQL